MAKEDVFNAHVSSMSMYGGLFKEIVKEVGLEKALKMHAKQGEPFGTAMGEMLKQKLGKKKADTKTLNAIAQPMMEGFGMDPQIDVAPESLKVKTLRCPMYEGFKAAGIDHKTIEKMCNGMANAEGSVLTKIYPSIEYSWKFKASPDGYCLEEFKITK